MASSLCTNLPFLSPPYPSSSNPKPSTTTRTSFPVQCGPRDNRGPLVKGRVLSTEAILAIQALKRAHRSNPAKVPDVLSKSFPRLVKSDLIAAFKELLRQNQCGLAADVFSVVRSEPWYRTDLSLYAVLVAAMGRNRMREEIDGLICDLEAEGEGSIPCDDKGIVQVLRAVLGADRVGSAVRIYGMMKRSGWGSDWVGNEIVVRVLSKGLRRLGEVGVADEVVREYVRLLKGNLEILEV
ncbi:protein THYLAKOID ASSEMBLY 8, chloroplastic [Malania oleifera]|uniref:protein THYLAKOID ASSEMBLY 8, chloroplastic n=1 Tax=Malania oleifera TaxID=397392 RepID=UPI0025AE4B5E|nr:protein THYLAKOID ASSEMBLY 8, chloroplastic [Malania oleifera]